ncbi:DUF397 domain-containing protein [Streptomyces chrestomyceticus]|uniref:DUF397 domain-containing protein n=1 Tax=Streptomyces chrestomyceticus TaxID=68185 RepID=UPI0027DB1AAF|nr:DUF397 domain-containing protein [Streptomyces chrestomyceticus]
MSGLTMCTYQWQKSSYSNAGANCLYVATASDGSLRMRESDEPEVVLSIAREGLAAFVTVIKESGVERIAKG